MASIFVLENSIDVLYVSATTHGQITRSNELFRQLSSHIKPVNIMDIFIEADKPDVLEVIEKAKACTPMPFRVYARTRQKTGADRYIVWNVYAIGDALFFIGIQLYDVSSVSSHEHERLKSLMQDVAFMAAHEVRQPLSSLLSLIDLMDSATGLTEECTELLNMAKQSAGALDKSVNQLLKKLTMQI